jgi:hypothetical protein
MSPDEILYEAMNLIGAGITDDDAIAGVLANALGDERTEKFILSMLDQIPGGRPMANRVPILMNFDLSNWYPNHHINHICPNGHYIDMDVAERLIEMAPIENEIHLHYIIDRESLVLNAGPFSVECMISEDSLADVVDGTRHGVLHCLKCNARWPSSGDLYAVT